MRRIYAIRKTSPIFFRNFNVKWHQPFEPTKKNFILNQKVCAKSEFRAAKTIRSSIYLQSSLSHFFSQFLERETIRSVHYSLSLGLQICSSQNQSCLLDLGALRLPNLTIFSGNNFLNSYIYLCMYMCVYIVSAVWLKQMI